MNKFILLVTCFFLVFEIFMATVKASEDCAHQALREPQEQLMGKAGRGAAVKLGFLWKSLCIFFSPFVSFAHTVKVKWLEKSS